MLFNVDEVQLRDLHSFQHDSQDTRKNGVNNLVQELDDPHVDNLHNRDKDHHDVVGLQRRTPDVHGNGHVNTLSKNCTCGISTVRKKPLLRNKKVSTLSMNWIWGTIKNVDDSDCWNMSLKDNRDATTARPHLPTNPSPLGLLGAAPDVCNC